eukprot:m.1639760 g.1639760  ORF g.1639760 m.1639760 type:complete len:668 (+) comp37803_c0_seq1:467-2470(+)
MRRVRHNDVRVRLIVFLFATMSMLSHHRHVNATNPQTKASRPIQVLRVSHHNFSGSQSPSNVSAGGDFFGTGPLPDAAGYSCGAELTGGDLGTCAFATNDKWLNDVLPTWNNGRNFQGNRTIPFLTGLSGVRILGGLATHNATTDTYTPHPEFDLVSRSVDNTSVLVYNWTRADITLDGFVNSGVQDFIIVLDNVPYAFVRPENRYYCPFGLGSAPDNVNEYAQFVVDFVQHLCTRYGRAVVNRWRFRLGTEADGPRYGPPWQSEPYFGNNGRGGTVRLTHGLETYITVYSAVVTALKVHFPAIRVGPSNMAGIGASVNASNNTVDAFLMKFGDAIRTQELPLDFAAISEYSRVDASGRSPADLMCAGVDGLRHFTEHAGKQVPLEIHEFGWAGWLPFTDPIHTWATGAFGAAWSAGAWLWVRGCGITNVFHWTYAFDYTVATVNTTGAGGGQGNPAHPRGYPLITAWGWLLGAMVDMSGSDATTRASATSEFVVRVPSSTLSYSNSFGVFRVAREDTRQLHFLLVSTSPEYTDKSHFDFVLDVSAADFPSRTPFWPLVNTSSGGPVVMKRYLNRSNSVTNVIKKDLVEMGLAYDNDTDAVDEISKMTSHQGVVWLGANVSKYMAIGQNALQSRPFEGSISYAADAISLRDTMQVSSMALLTLGPGV